ncbi:hypothetical protein FOBRF1_000419 [Fusarium oxysporum]
MPLALALITRKCPAKDADLCPAKRKAVQSRPNQQYSGRSSDAKLPQLRQVFYIHRYQFITDIDSGRPSEP